MNTDNRTNETEFRIDFSILERKPGEDDFTEIGFGATVPASRKDSCAFDVLAQVQNGEWDEV